jgi:hypothetical protein
MVNIHHCVFDKLLVCALGLSQIFDHLLVDVCVYVKQKKLGSMQEHNSPPPQPPIL